MPGLSPTSGLSANGVTYATDSSGNITGLAAGSSVIPLNLYGGVKVINPRGLRRWRAAAAKAQYDVARIHCIGDSVTMGAYCNDTTAPVDATADLQSWPGRLRALLATRFGATQAGWMSANDSRVTVTGGSVTISVGPALHTTRTDNVQTLGGAVSLGVGNTLSFAVPSCTNIDIYSLDSNTNSAAGGVGGNTGTFSWAVDGGGATTTSADNTNPISYKKTSISGLSQATHTLLLTGVSNTCYIAGIVYYSANGVIVSRFGLSSGTCLDVSAQGKTLSVATGGPMRVLGSLSASAAPTTITGSTTSGSNVVTGISSTSGLSVGMPVGANAQLNAPCWIQSVDSSTQITLTNTATATNAARTLIVGSGTTIASDLCIIALGHNDWQLQNDSTYPTTLTVFQTQMQFLINVLVAQGACVLLVGEAKSNATAPSPQAYVDSDYWTMLKTLAAANSHVAAIQINEAWGTFQQGVDLGLQNSTSGVHPLKKGHADFAGIIAKVLDVAANEASLSAVPW